MPFDKVRIRFRKDGDLRLVSHHDLMRAFERMLRRSGLSVRYSEGFHPQPRMVFALSLPLGVSGLQEVVEIEWTEPIEPAAALDRLVEQAPRGLHFLSAKRIDIRQSAKPRRAVYRMAFGPSSPFAPRKDVERRQLAERCADIINSSELWIERERPRPRQVNIRPYVNKLRVIAYAADDEGRTAFQGRPLELGRPWKAVPPVSDEQRFVLEMDLWVSQEGGARADEIVRALGLNHLLDDGAVIERAVLDIEDEISPEEAAKRPILPGRDDRAALERPSEKSPAQAIPQPAVQAVHWGASPSGPIVE